MKQVHYIDKTFPITLQDLNELAKVHKKDPKDLNIEIPSTGYVQCAVLNQEGDIQLYPKNGYPPQTKQSHIKVGRFEEAQHLLNQIKNLSNVDLHIVSEIDLKDLDEAYQLLSKFYEKQQIN